MSMNAPKGMSIVDVPTFEEKMLGLFLRIIMYFQVTIVAFNCVLLVFSDKN